MADLQPASGIFHKQLYLQLQKIECIFDFLPKSLALQNSECYTITRTDVRNSEEIK